LLAMRERSPFTLELALLPFLIFSIPQRKKEKKEKKRKRAKHKHKIEISS